MGASASALDRFADNAILWTTRADAPVVGTIDGFGDFLSFAMDRGYATARITIDELQDVDLLVLPASRARYLGEWPTISA